MTETGRLTQDLFEDIRDAILLDRPIPEDTAALLAARPADDPSAHWGANRTIYQVLRAKPGKRARLREVYSLGRAQGEAGPMRELAAYLQFYRAFDLKAGSLRLDNMGPTLLAEQRDVLLTMLAEAEAMLPAAGAHQINRAKILSLTDRAGAVACLEAAREASPVFYAALNWDQGMHTYLADSVLAGPPPAYDFDAWLPSLRAGLAGRTERFAAPKANLVWSMNPRFLRAHGPQWFELAPALMGTHGLGMIILMVGEADEVDPVVDEARDLIARTARFHGVSCPDEVARSVVFARMPLPAFVAAPNTFYASARYLHVRQVLAETGLPAVILDADFTPKQPFDAMLAFAGVGDVAFPISRGHSALSPWRRYIAMTGYFNATEGAARYLEAVERYLLHGLGAASSWMLDQNALDYAKVSLGEAVMFQNLNSIARPGGQDAIRKALEHLEA